jgi:hypothetical protein
MSHGTQDKLVGGLGGQNFFTDYYSFVQLPHADQGKSFQSLCTNKDINHDPIEINITPLLLSSHSLAVS